EDLPALSLLERLSALVEHFEADWRAGKHTRIEALLDEIPESDRTEALRQLIALEMDLRRLSGESPDAAGYLGRFPNHAEAISRWFAEGGTDEGPPTARLGAAGRPAVDVDIDAELMRRMTFLAPAAEPGDLGRLGGYRILGLLGAG